MADWVDVARVGEIADGAHAIAEIDDTRIAVFNLGGEYFAIEDVCTHDYECLTGGDVEGDVIVCPRHGARFSIRTGAALSAPAYEPTATFPVQVAGETIQVRDARWD
ncbi:MAG: non-heme iron oxygenase ferredoxin subunit [Chromatiales bacterium]|nr:non-heme iron oxygenase ferredoxin subunit [Chromatiales bacterium]